MNISDIYLDEFHQARLKSWDHLMNKYKNCESNENYSLDDLMKSDEYNCDNVKYRLLKNRNKSRSIEVNDEESLDSSDLYQSETDSVDSVSYVLKCKEQSKNCNKIKLKKMLDLENNPLCNTTQIIPTNTSPELISENTHLKYKDEHKINNNYRKMYIVESSSEDKSDYIFSDTKEKKLLEETPKENSIIEQTSVDLNKTPTQNCNIVKINAKPSLNIEKTIFFLNQDKLEEMKKKDKEVFEKSCEANFIKKINCCTPLESKLNLERKQFNSKSNLILNEIHVKCQEEPVNITYTETTNISKKQICNNDLKENGAKDSINILGNVDAGNMLPNESSLNIQENFINNKSIECTKILNETYLLHNFDDNKIYNENAKIKPTKLLNCSVTENNEQCKIGNFDKTLNETKKQSQNLNGKIAKYTTKKTIAKEHLVRNGNWKDNSEITTFTKGLIHQQPELKSICAENIESDYSTPENSVIKKTQIIKKQGSKCTKYRDSLKMINPEYINAGKTNQENTPEITDSENIHESKKEQIHNKQRKLKKYRKILNSCDTENIKTDYVNQENVSKNSIIHENQKELIHKSKRKLNKYREQLKNIDAENINQEVSENSAFENIYESKKELSNRESIDGKIIESDNSKHKLKKYRERLKNIDADNIETDETSNSASSNISEASNPGTKTNMLHWGKLEIINTENAGIFPCNLKDVKHDKLKNHESMYTKRKRRSPVKKMEEIAKKQNLSLSTKRNFNPKHILNPASKSVKLLTLDYFLNDEFWGERYFN